MRLKHWFYTIPLRLRSLFRRSQVEQELDEELRYHIERQTEELIAKGMTAEEARYAALRVMGGVERRKEECRDTWRVRWIELLAQDLRYGLRMLLKSPGFCAVAVVSLGLGIGVNAAIFSLFNAVFLKTFPVDNPEGLIYVIQDMGYAPASYQDYLDYCEGNKSFSGLAACSNGATMALTEQGQIQMVNAEVVSGNYFSVLAIQPAMGRAFIDGEDDRLGAEATVMISHALWRRLFNSDPGLIGKQISLKENKVTVIGILPERFTGKEPAMPADVWLTIPVFARIEYVRPLPMRL
jgi:putative ABC transport system permease protein